MYEKEKRPRCGNTKASQKKKLIYARYRNRMVPIGYIKDSIFHRKCKSTQLYRAMGGSLGLDLSVADQLKREKIHSLHVSIQDWEQVFTITLSKFLSMAKPRSFYGVTRLHLPFDPYWENITRQSIDPKEVKQLNLGHILEEA
jgi:hypothetical protein